MGNNNGGCSLRLAIIYWPLVPKQRGSVAEATCRNTANAERGKEKRGRDRWPHMHTLSSASGQASRADTKGQRQHSNNNNDSSVAAAAAPTTTATADTREREAGQRQHVLNTFNDNYKNNNNNSNNRKDRNNNKSKNDSVSVVGSAGSLGGGRREQKRLN